MIAKPFHLALREARRSTIDPDTGKAITQKRLAELIGIGFQTVSRHERSKHLPAFHIRKEYFRLLPSLLPYVHN